MNPTSAAARYPARDFRAAKGRNGAKGTCEGREGDARPTRRPMVDAAVSDHARLHGE